MISAILLLLLVAQVSKVLGTDVTWESPVAGDIFVPGDTLQAVWTASEKVISPSFTICIVDNSTSASDAADCGTAVWPPIDQNGTQYSISLAVPNITGNGDYYLVMKDDTGKVYDTPNFSLTLNESSSTSSTSQPTGTSTSITYLPSHSAPTAAAIAIPLSLVAAALMSVVLLFLARSCRSRGHEKDKHTEAHLTEKVGSRDSTISFASATDLERAILALATSRGYTPGGNHGYPVAYSGPLGSRGLSATAAAVRSMGTFGWSYRGSASPQGKVDAYTPAPVPKYSMEPAAGSVHAPPTSEHRSNPAYAPQILPERTEGLQPQPVNWQQINWRDIGLMLANEPACSDMSRASGPPQLPAIRMHLSSPPIRVESPLPPPVPPKPLMPASSAMQYTPTSASFSASTETHHSSTPAAEGNISFNVISNYLQPSPAIPRATQLAPPNSYVDSHSELRVPAASVTRTRSLRRLETAPGSQDNEKLLPLRPEDRIGTDLYDAVAKAVGGQ